MSVGDYAGEILIETLSLCIISVSLFQIAVDKVTPIEIARLIIIDPILYHLQGHLRMKL